MLCNSTITTYISQDAVSAKYPITDTTLTVRTTAGNLVQSMSFTTDNTYENKKTKPKSDTK